jgi:hypothetical protein
MGFVARLFRGEGLIANFEKIPASEDAGYKNQRISIVASALADRAE